MVRPARVVNGGLTGCAGAGAGAGAGEAAGGGARCVEAAGGEKDILGAMSLDKALFGADISGGKNGLSLSIDTVQGLSPRRITKVLADRSRTSKGPEYGGVRGCFTASTRTNTAGQLERDDGTA